MAVYFHVFDECARVANDVYWHVNLLTYAWEGLCILAAHACTKVNI